MTALTSRGKSAWDTLRTSLDAFKKIRPPEKGLKTLNHYVITHPEGAFVNSMTCDGFFDEATEVLVNSGQVYRYQDTICLEVQELDSQQLV